MVLTPNRETLMKKLLLLALFSSCTFAAELDLNQYSDSLDYAQVTKAVASQSADGTWCFNTTVRHNDEGWEHYADGWEVTDLEGKQLGFRLLLHPHETEQPFTRSLCGVKIPVDVTKVVVRARCKVHGYGGKAVLIELESKK